MGGAYTERSGPTSSTHFHLRGEEIAFAAVRKYQRMGIRKVIERGLALPPQLVLEFTAPLWVPFFMPLCVC